MKNKAEEFQSNEDEEEEFVEEESSEELTPSQKEATIIKIKRLKEIINEKERRKII